MISSVHWLIVVLLNVFPLACKRALFRHNLRDVWAAKNCKYLSAAFKWQSNWLLPVLHSSALQSIFRCSVGPWFLLITETDESVFWADEHSRRESRVTAADTLHAPRCHWVASGQVGPPQGDQYRGPHAYTSGINFAEYIQVMTVIGWSNDDTMFLFIRGFHRKVLVIWWRLETSELHPNSWLRMS